MKNKKEKNSFKKGSALAYVLVILAAVSIILVAMFQNVTSTLRFSMSKVEREKAFQVAEAGIYYYRWYLAHELSGKTAEQVRDFWENGDPYGVDEPYEAEISDPEGGAIGKYSIEVDAPDPSSTIVIARSTGWGYKNPDLKRTIQVRFRRPSWSEYAVLANDFMRFGTGTEIFGKVHSNAGIRFDGLTHNIMTSAVEDYNDPDHSGGNEFGVHTHISPTDPLPPDSVPDRPDVFEAGREFPVASIDFTGVVSDLSYIKSQSQIAGQGLYFDDSDYGRHIILKNDGTMDVSRVLNYNTSSNSITSESSSTNYDIPDEGVVYVEDNAWIEGSIDGVRVTMVAANLIGGPEPNIYLGDDNLDYTNYDGSDVVGLIAQGDIEIIRDSLDVLTIDAALIAQTGRVGREHYGSWCVSWRRVWFWWICEDWETDHKDTITVNGSIATNQRYGFAWTDGTGYETRILNFDNNLIYYPPPYFPTGSEYALDLWEEI